MSSFPHLQMCKCRPQTNKGCTQTMDNLIIAVALVQISTEFNAFMAGNFWATTSFLRSHTYRCVSAALKQIRAAPKPWTISAVALVQISTEFYAFMAGNFWATTSFLRSHTYRCVSAALKQISASPESWTISAVALVQINTESYAFMADNCGFIHKPVIFSQPEHTYH